VELLVIPLVVIAIVYMFCPVCHKRTKFLVTKGRFNDHYDDYHCDECNIIQPYKTE
jgi:hypothetical protein